jgi:hypothetical protein
MTLPDGANLDDRGHQGTTPGVGSGTAVAIAATGTNTKDSRNPWTLDVDDLVQRSMQKKALFQQDASEVIGSGVVGSRV